MQLHFLIVIFASRRLEAKAANHPREDEVVEEEVDDANRNDIHPIRLCLTLENTEDEKVEEAARERKTDGNVEHVRDHIGRACKNDLHSKECRSDKEEREFDRLCDTCENRRERCGKEQALGSLLL